MDEPFSALDVLTAETLRGELLELWLGHKIPTRAVFIVTHNIEEAVVLADRIIVLGRHPAHIHADFAVALPHPRDRKSPEFLDLVDSIYRVLTRPEHKDGSVPPRTRIPGVAPKSKAVMLPHTRPGGMPGLLEILVGDGLPDDPGMRAQHLRVALADVLEQAGGAFDVGEQERDRPGREIRRPWHLYPLAGQFGLEPLERVPAGPAEVRGPAQRGPERALQHGVIAAAEGAGHRGLGRTQGGQRDERGAVPALARRGQAVRAERLAPVGRDPVAGPRGRVHEADGHFTALRDGAGGRAGILADDVQGGAPHERGKQVDLDTIGTDPYRLHDAEVGDGERRDLRVVDGGQRLPHGELDRIGVQGRPYHFAPGCAR